MDSGPRELSLAEIRSFMLKNNCKVTNHALVKHFRAFLTNKETQDEARKLFKSYVNTLASIKNEGDEKFLILRKKYINECPSEDAVNVNLPMSPGSRSLTAIPSDGENSPFKIPPPYRPPPEVFDPNNPYQYQGSPRGSIALSRKNSSDTGRSGSEYSFGSEFTGSDSRKIGSSLVRSESGDSRLLSEAGSRKQSVDLYKLDSSEEAAPAIPPRKRTSVDQSAGQLRQISIEEKSREPIANIPTTTTASEPPVESNKENEQNTASAEHGTKNASVTTNADQQQQEENKVSVKEKMMKFNRFASEEEAKVPSPIGKKKPEKGPDDTLSSENLLQHPKAKEWLIAAANANYQELAKLSTDSPNLVKLQDMSTGYTALHWAAKHGNEDVVKLVAGTLKADVNARTNGGYTALHIAMQFGRNDIFELLCNVYKADRDLLDWSGKKPLEYQKQMTSVSASTYSKIKARKKHTEKDSGFLRIGSLNVRVKKTTEAFSNFLGVGTNTTRLPPTMRTSAPPNSAYFEKIHKSWGSADNIPHEDGVMPPPKYGSVKKRRPKRDAEYDPANDHFSQSVPTTPSQTRAPIGILSENPDTESENPGDSDSDTACGFDSNWRPTYL